MSSKFFGFLGEPQKTAHLVEPGSTISGHLEQQYHPFRKKAWHSLCQREGDGHAGNRVSPRYSAARTGRGGAIAGVGVHRLPAEQWENPRFRSCTVGLTIGLASQDEQNKLPLPLPSPIPLPFPTRPPDVLRAGSGARPPPDATHAGCASSGRRVRASAGGTRKAKALASQPGPVNSPCNLEGSPQHAAYSRRARASQQGIGAECRRLRHEGQGSEATDNHIKKLNNALLMLSRGGRVGICPCRRQLQPTRCCGGRGCGSSTCFLDTLGEGGRLLAMLAGDPRRLIDPGGILTMIFRRWFRSQSGFPDSPLFLHLSR